MNTKDSYIKNSSIILTIILIINIITKLLFISTNSIAGDEPFSIFHAQMDINSIIDMLYSENNPPFHFFFLHFWIKLFGISAFSVRLPSLIFSCCTVLYIYKIGKEHFNYPIAIMASLLFTFSNYHIFFAHEARVYPMFALLTTVSMYYFLNICNEKSEYKNYLGLLLSNVLLIYAHYFGFFVIFTQVLIFYLTNNFRKLFKFNLIYAIALIVLYIPNLHILALRFMQSSVHGTWVKAPNGIESIYNMLWQFSNKPLPTVLSIGIMIAALVKLFIKKDYQKYATNSFIIAIWFLFPFFLMFGISYAIPMFIDRYLIFVSIGYYFLIAVCAFYILAGSKFRYLVPGILIIMFAITFNPKVDNKRHANEAIAKIQELKDSTTAVFICPDYFVFNFTYYYNMELFRSVKNQNDLTQMTSTLNNQKIFPLTNIRDVNTSSFNRILYLDAAANFSYPDNHIFDTLSKNFTLINSYKFYEIYTIHEFIKPKGMTCNTAVQ